MVFAMRGCSQHINSRYVPYCMAAADDPTMIKRTISPSFFLFFISFFSILFLISERFVKAFVCKIK